MTRLEGLFPGLAGSGYRVTSGAWTSKLGDLDDIEHPLRAIEGEIYGRVVLILERKVTTWE